MSRLSTLCASLLALLAFACLSFATAPAAFACHEHGDGTGGGVYDGGSGDEGDWEEKCSGGPPLIITVPEMNASMTAEGVVAAKCAAHYLGATCEAMYYVCSKTPVPANGTCEIFFTTYRPALDSAETCTGAIDWVKYAYAFGMIEEVYATTPFCTPQITWLKPEVATAAADRRSYEDCDAIPSCVLYVIFCDPAPLTPYSTGCVQRLYALNEDGVSGYYSRTITVSKKPDGRTVYTEAGPHTFVPDPSGGDPDMDSTS